MTILRISECQLLDIIWNHLVLVLAFDLQFHCKISTAATTGVVGCERHPAFWP